MLYQGIVQEYLTFKQLFPPGHDMFKGELILPIGYKQIEQLIQDFKSFLAKSNNAEHSSQCGNRHLEENHFDKLFLRFFRDFSGNTRHYSTYQLKYARSHLQDFEFLNVSQTTSEEAAELIFHRLQSASSIRTSSVSPPPEVYLFAKSDWELVDQLDTFDLAQHRELVKSLRRLLIAHIKLG